MEGDARAVRRHAEAERWLTRWVIVSCYRGRLRSRCEAKERGQAGHRGGRHGWPHITGQRVSRQKRLQLATVLAKPVERVRRGLVVVSFRGVRPCLGRAWQRSQVLIHRLALAAIAESVGRGERDGGLPRCESRRVMRSGTYGTPSSAPRACRSEFFRQCCQSCPRSKRLSRSACECSIADDNGSVGVSKSQIECLPRQICWLLRDKAQ